MTRRPKSAQTCELCSSDGITFFFQLCIVCVHAERRKLYRSHGVWSPASSCQWWTLTPTLHRLMVSSMPFDQMRFILVCCIECESLSLASNSIIFGCRFNTHLYLLVVKENCFSQQHCSRNDSNGDECASVAVLKIYFTFFFHLHLYVRICYCDVVQLIFVVHKPHFPLLNVIIQP